MKKLNEDKLISLVDKFLEPFGLDSDMDLDFAYDDEDERVYFSIILTERADRLFKKYIVKEFNFDPPNIFMMSLLHEVGHAYTMPLLSKKEKKRDRKAKKVIEKEFEKTNSDEVYSQYFDLEIERIATEWAVNYYKANTDYCDKFYSKFEKALHKEYKRINLTE